MKVCVLNTGSNHAIYRTIALSKFCEIEVFIQIGPQDHHHKALNDAGIKSVSLNYKGFTAVKIARYLKKKTKADYYICHYAYGYHIDACIYAGLKNIAVIAMGSDILYNGSFSQEFRKKKFVLNNVKYISAKSEEIIELLKKWQIRTKCALNYWGEDTIHFFQIPENEAKKLLNLENNKNIFLSSRTIGRLYNIDLIAKAFVEINSKIENALFIFIGRISDRDYLDDIEKYFLEHGLTNYRIIGDLDKEEVNLYYNASKIVYSFSDREGFPNTFFEVFACKANLICGQIKTLDDFCKRNHTELNMCQFDAKSVASKTMEILSNTEYSNCLIENNFRVFNDFGNLSNNAYKFFDDVRNTGPIHSNNISVKIKLLILDILLIITKKLKNA